MFEPDSKDGNYLIDFALHGKDCRKTVKKEILDDFFMSCEIFPPRRSGGREKCYGKEKTFPLSSRSHYDNETITIYNL